MIRHLIKEGKSRIVYKVHVEASVELDEDLSIEADDEDEAINEAEAEAYDMLTDPDIFTEVLGKEVVEEPAVYEYELESGEYTITAAELIDYNIVINSREFRRLFRPTRPVSVEPDNKEYLFRTPGSGVGIFDSYKIDIYGALGQEAYVIPYISIALSDNISVQDQEDILASPELVLNGNKLYRIEIETDGNYFFIPKEPIGKCAFRKDISAEDASSYGDSDVKRMIDAWTKSII